MIVIATWFAMCLSVGLQCVVLLRLSQLSRHIDDAIADTQRKIDHLRDQFDAQEPSPRSAALLSMPDRTPKYFRKAER